MADPKETPTSPEGVGQLLDKPTEKVEKEGAVQEPVKGAGDKEVTTPTPRVYSEEEVGKMQSGWDTKDAARTKEMEGLNTKLTDLQTQYDTIQTQTEEAKIADWLKSVETGGGDVAQAQQVANAQREVGKQMREIQKQKLEASERDAKANAALKVINANDLAKEHSLGDDAVKELLDCATPEAMEVKALKMKIEKSAGEEKLPAKVSSEISSTKGLDLEHMTITQKLGYAVELEEAKRRK